MTLSHADRRAVLQVLKEARDLICKGWTQHVLARNSNGNSVFPEGYGAVQWCPIGALDRAVGHKVYYRPKALTELRLVDVALWNDNPKRTKAQVLARFNKAITRLEAQA